MFIEASWPVPSEDFPADAWHEMHRYIYNGHRPEAITKRIVPIIKAWLPYPTYWNCGQYMARAPYGSYIWVFAVEIEQNRRWNYPEFQAGRKFGRNIETWWAAGARRGSPRDTNPWPKMAYERYIAWDAGYILGCTEQGAASCGGWEAYS